MAMCSGHFMLPNGNYQFVFNKLSTRNDACNWLQRHRIGEFICERIAIRKKGPSVALELQSHWSGRFLFSMCFLLSFFRFFISFAHEKLMFKRLEYAINVSCVFRRWSVFDALAIGAPLSRQRVTHWGEIHFEAIKENNKCINYTPSVW